MICMRTTKPNKHFYVLFKFLCSIFNKLFFLKINFLRKLQVLTKKKKKSSKNNPKYKFDFLRNDNSSYKAENYYVVKPWKNVIVFLNKKLCLTTLKNYKTKKQVLSSKKLNQKDWKKVSSIFQWSRKVRVSECMGI